jgi:hypothetical protein
MRLDARSVLLGLVALGAIPEASCRVLYDYPQAYNGKLERLNIKYSSIELIESAVDPFYNVTEVVARAVVVPVKPIVPIKPKPPVAPGGDRSPGAVEPAAPAPLKPGGEGTPNSNPEPAPLKPAEKPDANKPDAEPLAPADKPDGTAADRDGAATGTKDKDGFFVDEPEIVCKRSIGLSKRSGTCSPWDTTRSNYRQRGRDIDAEIHGTRTHSTVDYASRLDDRTRYSRRREESPDAYPEDLVGSNGRGYDNEFGYPTERGEWDSHSVRSTHRRGNGNEYDEDLEPITVSSYGRGRRRNARPEDDEDAIGLMTHDIYGERDRVRFQQDSRNDVMRDSAGRPLCKLALAVLSEAQSAEAHIDVLC